MDKPIKKNKHATLNSQEVAKMVGKRHDNLVRDIDTYIKQMEEANKTILKTTSKVRACDYFIESTYLGGNGEQRPCYEISKMGCDFIAHKLNGTKGTAFTATYIKRFYEMEQNQYKIPNYPEALRLYADEYERSTKLKIELSHKQDVIDGLVKDIPIEGKRKLINRVVRYKGASFKERWDLLYKQFEYDYGLKSIEAAYKKYNQSHKPKLTSKIDYVDKILGMIPELYKTACVLFESDIRELQRKMFSTINPSAIIALDKGDYNAEF